MKENIGQKIKRIRTEIGLTQDNVHHNQSQISQIESGRINNPDENTLEIIAANLKLTLEELIENTGWEKPESPVINTELGFSPVMVDVEIDDTGNITWAHKTFPKYNSKGEKNEFCPLSGMKLITHCNKCGRQVEDITQKYCYGCGYSFFGKIEIGENITQILAENQIFTDQDTCADAIHALVSEREKLSRVLTSEILTWELNQRDLAELEPALEDAKQKGKKLEQLIKDTDKKDMDKESAQTLLESKTLLKEIIAQIDDVEDQKEKVDNNPTPRWTAVIYWRFNLQITEAAIKKLKSIVNSLEPLPLPPPPTIEETKAGLYSQLANQTGLYMMKILDPYDLKSGHPESEGTGKEGINKIEQLTKMMQQIEKIKDPVKLIDIMKDIMLRDYMIAKDQNISTGTDEDKSESTENNDSSSKVEEKSNNNKKMKE